jgi:CRP/FNR family transcriptional regulator
MIYLNDRFELPVSRKEIAELIGMTTENVIRILSEFRKEGIIRINGKEIEIADKTKLQFLSEHA